MKRLLTPLLFVLVLTFGAGLALAGDTASEAPAAEKSAESSALTNTTVTVGCGMCQLGKSDDKSCKWAVEIEDTPYTVEGALPHDHDSHAADGMCKTKRTAVVDGELKDGTFVATRFELVPVEGGKKKKKK